MMDSYRNELLFAAAKGKLFVDIEQLYLTGIKRLFPFLNMKKQELNELPDVDFAAIFDTNLGKIKQQLSIQKLNLSQLDIFNAYNNNRSLIYFDQHLIYINKYKNWLAGKTTITSGSAAAGSSDPLSGYFNPVGMVIKNSKTTHTGKAPAFGSGGGGNGGGGSGSGKRVDGGASSDTKDLIGLVAEKMVYEQLIKDNFQSVTWVSKNAAKAKVNPEGTDDYGYDIGYIDSLGKDHFIEVKGKGDDVKHFFITSPEFRRAVDEKDFYHVVFVPFALDNSHREMHDLGNIFIFTQLEDIFSNERFTAKFNTLEIDFT